MQKAPDNILNYKLRGKNVIWEEERATIVSLLIFFWCLLPFWYSPTRIWGQRRSGWLAARWVGSRAEMLLASQVSSASDVVARGS